MFFSGDFTLIDIQFLSTPDYSHMSIAFNYESYLSIILPNKMVFAKMHLRKVSKNKSETFKTIALAQNLIR